MPTQDHPPRKFRLPLALPPDPRTRALPPALHSPISRGADGEMVKLIDNVTVLASYELAAAKRSGEAPETLCEALGQALLALEAQDGSTVFIRADRLHEDLSRLFPEALSADGDAQVIDFALFRERDGLGRGGLGSWIWKRLSVLQLDPDAIADDARDQAIDWLGGELAARLTGQLGEKALYAASWLGTKALMKAIEARLAGVPGLYQWSGAALAASDLCRAGDGRFKAWAEQPGLLFIHGTGSHTVGSFGELGGGDDWRALQRCFGDRIFGFEHRSFSESPIDNALALLEVLPENARICLATHSRGGLVGDLLCLGSFSAATRALIGEYRRLPRPDEEDAEAHDPALRELREKVAAEEQAKLGRLIELLEQKSPRVERYVRVACPAAGSALLSDKLEVFLSCLLALVRKLGAWGAGVAVGALATPLTGKAAKDAADQLLKLLGRVVLEIADKRLQPQYVPGIEAMLPEAPMGAFLARAPRRQGIRMAVIAGDSEGGSVLRRIGAMFTDWMLFDRADNDLVVDTASMYAGLAAGSGAYALLDQGENVSHFSYFRNPRTRSALRGWLLDETPAAEQGWSELPAAGAPLRGQLSRGDRQAPADNSRPVLIMLPGIMGSHLEVNRQKPDTAGSGDRVWMDYLDLPRGGLKKIARDAPDVFPEDLLEPAYGDLARYLEDSHRVVRFAYDWRIEIAANANRLGALVRQLLDAHPEQPLRLLAHGLGGLLVRAMIAMQPELWKEAIKRPGSRLLLLGTPNHGSHAMVETLLGKSNGIRLLARIDQTQGLQPLLDLVAAFPGALQLLPEPGFKDSTGLAARDYFDPATWSELAENNNDFWFGKKLGGKPSDADLKNARAFWKELRDPQDNEDKADKARPIAPIDRVAYIFGQADNTPCGIRASDKGIEMLGTPHGDGSVTWKSGRLDWLPDERCWLMPVDHLGLTSTRRYFDDLVELLASGSSTRLGRLPAARGTASAAAPLRAYQPGPIPGFPSEPQLLAALFGAHRRALAPGARRKTLAVGVTAMDLRFLQHPILCGHYLGDPISGPEAAIDDCLVDGALSQRQRLGVHAAALGSTSVVLMPRGHEDALRGTWRGALVVGLGEMGELSSRELSETVRAGVLRLLLHADDRCLGAAGAQTGEAMALAGPCELTLASLLIGFNSTVNISLDESVKAITLGVLEANHQFAQGRPTRTGASPLRTPGRAPTRVARLEFVELYRDAAITAAYAVRDLPASLAQELKRLDLRIDAAGELGFGPGVRRRLSLSAASSYWPRLMVCAADEIPGPGATPPAPEAPARRLKFVFLGQRARAETVVDQGQPGLVDSLVRDVVRSPRYTPATGIGNTLFHLLVPLDFKAAAREASNLLLAVDEATANIPWEMLEADGQPLLRNTRLIRQLISPRYRQHPLATRERSALLVVNPSTRGYHAQFGGPGWTPRVKANGEVDEDRLVSLPGAQAEAETVGAVLEKSGYQISETPSDAEAGDVFGKLFARPYRLLIVSAHGVHRVQARNGSWRSGVVLSDGLLLSAAELGRMEVVPELVFLNCCHLGKMDDRDRATADSHRLAYSLARELIEMGARCVVASGWEVDDAAGRTFAEIFFSELTTQGSSFARALHEARAQAYAQHPGINTWGAFQAYGDPDYRLEIRERDDDDEERLLAPDELLDWLERRRLDALRPGSERRGLNDLQRAIERRLRALPPAWLDRPDIQQTLGLLYAEYGAAGFAAARAALCRAIAEEAKSGVVALSSIEQLANIEARQAERLGHDENTRQAAVELLDAAITRLRELIRIASPDPSAPPPAEQANGERQALLGSALKRQAALRIAGGAPWAEARTLLAQAADAYRAGQGRADASGFNPYAMINRLQLDALLGQREAGLAALIENCQSAARRRFAQGYDFFDGVMAVDAELAALLAVDADLEPLQGLASRYQDAVVPLSTSARQFDSVLAQLSLMARFVEARGGAGDAARAQALAAIARQLDPQRAAGEPGSAAADSVPRAAAGPGKAAAKARGQRKRGG